MKMTVNEERCLVVEEVYCDFVMRTSEGNEISICMRDDTFEINVMPKGESTGNWWRVDMQSKAMAPLCKKTKEEGIIKAFLDICTPSINPDLYSCLEDEIIPALYISRGVLKDNEEQVSGTNHERKDNE